jgi:ribonucleotide reductase alpha subunit
MLKVFNDTAKYVNQGGKRNGSFAIYLEPWHADIEEFLRLKLNTGNDDERARDLFYGLWIPDLFMQRVEQDGMWCLMTPDECPGLSDSWGDEFNSLYLMYERQRKYVKEISAKKLWQMIVDAQIQTGTPYLLYKDACNAKSNQQHLGTIKSSNLCTEIIQYSDKDETAVCNLASIALNRFVHFDTDISKYIFNYEHLHDVVRVVTQNLNHVIDINYYPTEKTRTSNFRHRPIGIGIQGLADVFFMMNIAFHSEEAVKINKLIFETIYHASLSESNLISAERSQFFSLLKTAPFDLSTVENFKLTDEEYNNLKNTPDLLGAYSSFIGSPMSRGIFQFDMWNTSPTHGRYDWDSLRSEIMKYGLRNSLLVAPMPTASTSQILGNNECFEPITSNIYMRRTLAGEFIMVNKYLIREFIGLGIWNEKIKNNIIANRGSIQQLDSSVLMGLTDHIKNKYKTVWEIPMKHLIDMAADRGAFICQSQSLNLWLEEPNYNTLTSMHFYSWTRGLKTGIYYLRRKPKHQAQQFTIEPENIGKSYKEKDDGDSENISFSNYDIGGGSGNDTNTCEMCSS